MKYNFIVIGAGSAGLTVASAAAGLGAKVLLIEKNKMGGDCLNTGCVPSKALLKKAHGLFESRKLSSIGIKINDENFNFNEVMGHVQNSIKTIEPKDSKERYEKLGVTVIKGEASFVDNHTITVNGQNYIGKYIVIATGSSPFVPPIEGLDKCNYWTSENIFETRKFPKRLMVIGAGPIGLELGQGFAHLGSKVSVINRSSTLFQNDEVEVSEFMYKRLKSDGIKFYNSTNILKITKIDDEYKILLSDKNITTITVDQILVSTGRKPNTKGLNLEKIGIELSDRGYIKTDLKMRTNIKNIFACGDISGNLGFTHMAGYEASVVIRNAIFKLPYKADYKKAAWTTFTSPSVAHTGLTEKKAKELNLFADKVFLKLDDTDRFIVENETEGFLKIILDSKKRIIGATIVSENSSELIHTLTLMINQKMKLSALMDIIIPYPMRGDILKEAALKKSKELLTDRNKNLIKKLFLRL